MANMSDKLLTPEEIGDNLDLELEGNYPRSDGSSIHTISVDKLLKAQLAKFKGYKSPEEVEEAIKGEAEVSFKAGRLEGYLTGFNDGQSYSFTANTTIQAIKDEANKAGVKEERERIMKLLPQITERFDHNKTCFDCVERIKRQALKDKP